MKKKNESANCITNTVKAALTSFSHIPFQFNINNNLNLEFLF